MLNAEGLRRLGDGTFDGANPDFALLSAQNERPAGIYAWAVCAPRGMTAALPLVMEKISTPLYRKANMYTNAATEEGARFFEAIGLKRGATIHGHVHPKMFWLDRSGLSDDPAYDSYSVSQPEKRIYLVDLDTGQTYSTSGTTSSDTNGSSNFLNVPDPFYPAGQKIVDDLGQRGFNFFKKNWEVGLTAGAGGGMSAQCNAQGCLIAGGVAAGLSGRIDPGVSLASFHMESPGYAGGVGIGGVGTFQFAPPFPLVINIEAQITPTGSMFDFDLTFGAGESAVVGVVVTPPKEPK